jgi:hypothetical protein
MNLNQIDTFTPGQGVGQGDRPSAHIWNATLDILLRSMEAMDLISSSFQVNTSNGVVPGVTYAYADDIAAPKAIFGSATEGGWFSICVLNTNVRWYSRKQTESGD